MHGGVTKAGESNTARHWPNSINLDISTLCLVGLNPEDLNFFKMSIFFTF